MIVMIVKATRANLGQSALTFTLPENENCCLPTAWGWHAVLLTCPHVAAAGGWRGEQTAPKASPLWPAGGRSRRVPAGSDKLPRPLF